MDLSSWETTNHSPRSSYSSRTSWRYVQIIVFFSKNQQIQTDTGFHLEVILLRSGLQHSTTLPNRFRTLHGDFQKDIRKVGGPWVMGWFVTPINLYIYIYICILYMYIIYVYYICILNIYIYNSKGPLFFGKGVFFWKGCISTKSMGLTYFCSSFRAQVNIQTLP